MLLNLPIVSFFTDQYLLYECSSHGLSVHPLKDVGLFTVAGISRRQIAWLLISVHSVLYEAEKLFHSGYSISHSH